MPISTIDPTTALVVIDLQTGVSGLPTVPPVATRAGELAAEFRNRNLPVVLVNVVDTAPGRTEVSGGDTSRFPEGWTDLLPELAQHENDHTLSKSRWGAFHQTGLAEHLDSLGVTQVVLAGVATSVGVESTARAAYDHGLHVTIATDAVTDPDPEAEANSINRIFPKLGETGTVAEIVTALPTK